MECTKNKFGVATCFTVLWNATRCGTCATLFAAILLFFPVSFHTRAHLLTFLLTCTLHLQNQTGADAHQESWVVLIVLANRPSDFKRFSKEVRNISFLFLLFYFPYFLSLSLIFFPLFSLSLFLSLSFSLIFNSTNYSHSDLLQNS